MVLTVWWSKTARFSRIPVLRPGLWLTAN